MTESLVKAMNRVRNALAWSVASYLRFARPRIDAGAEGVADTVRHVAISHRNHVFRVGELRRERHGHVESRTVPIAFTRSSDLSVECLLPLVIEDEKEILAFIESAADAIANDADARELLSAVVETEKRHLRVLLGGLARSDATARLTSSTAT